MSELLAVIGDLEVARRRLLAQLDIAASRAAEQDEEIARLRARVAEETS